MAWAPDYVTTAELTAYLNIGDTVDDVQAALAISAASRAVDRHTNRQFGVVAAAEERFYTADWDRRRCRWVVSIDDLMTEAGMTVATDTGTVSFTLEPVNAAQTGRPWTFLVVDTDSAVVPTGVDNEVAVTAAWGWTAVPAPVKQATLLQAARLFNRRTSPYGIAGSPDMGGELRLLSKVDPDVAVVLGPYMRWWAGV